MRPVRTRNGRSSMALALTATAFVAIFVLLFGGFGPTPESARYLPTALSLPRPVQLSYDLRSRLSGVEAAPLSTNSSNSIYMWQTGHYVKDAFLNYWLMNGGVSLYGYPISEEFTDGGITMQYFERSRFEYNPNSSRPWKVELSPVGSILTEGRGFPPSAQTSSTPDRTWYEQTRHTLGGTFQQFWRNNGGLDIFGYPISEEMQESGKTIQYFERARFETPAQGRVQLGHLGAELRDKQVATGSIASPGAQDAQPRPGFNMSFRGAATWFRADWNRVISLNKGWGNLPQDYVGRGLYAAAPADLNLYGRWARVTRGNRSIFVQFVDVINWPDIPYVRSKGIVIDLGEEAYRALGTSTSSRYEVSFELLWPSDEP